MDAYLLGFRFLIGKQANTRPTTTTTTKKPLANLFWVEVNINFTREKQKFFYRIHGEKRVFISSLHKRNVCTQKLHTSF